jgi:DNA repair photolyase
MAPGKLVGIARLAHDAPVLLEKRTASYFELPAYKLLNKCDSVRAPFEWTINPYRGCEFGCKYCYARYTHEFMELREPDEFEWKIFAKRFNPADLRSDLRKIDPKDWVAMGTATDPYQPAERRYGLTRTVLEVMAAFSGRRFSITTKSDLITRDVDLLKEIAARNQMMVSLTITTLDEELARKLEPRAPRPALRLEALREVRNAGIHAGISAAPVMPLINDREVQLEELAKGAAEAGAQFMWANPLFLMPCSKAVFLPFLEAEFPKLADKYRRTFQKHAYLPEEYSKRLKERVDRVRAKYGLQWRSKNEEEARPAEEQMRLGFE